MANGTQCVAVDCQPTEKTRYEVDFQFTTEAIQKSAVVLGWENSGVRLGMWSNGNGNIECPFGTTDKDWSHGMIAYDTVRHTAIVDRKANVYTMTTSGNVVGTVQKPDHAGTVTGENHRQDEASCPRRESANHRQPHHAVSPTPATTFRNVLTDVFA